MNPLITEKLLNKQAFNITDFANIVMKKTETIRSWELKGIIDKPNVDSRHWRKYSRDELADCLEKVLNHSWERKVIKNEQEIQYVIDRLRNNLFTYTIEL